MLNFLNNIKPLWKDKAKKRRKENKELKKEIERLKNSREKWKNEAIKYKVLNKDLKNELKKNY
jgi:hypothetical protein